MNRGTFFVWLLALATAVAVVAGCQPQAQPQAAANPIKIGVQLPLTGGGAALGERAHVLELTVPSSSARPPPSRPRASKRFRTGAPGRSSS